jgi:hypothetical protein
MKWLVVALWSIRHSTLPEPVVVEPPITRDLSTYVSQRSANPQPGKKDDIVSVDHHPKATPKLSKQGQTPERSASERKGHLPRSELPYESPSALQPCTRDTILLAPHTDTASQASLQNHRRLARKDHARHSRHPLPCTRSDLGAKPRAMSIWRLRPAGFVAGSGCRVLLMGARVLERRLAERQVFGVLQLHQT